MARLDPNDPTLAHPGFPHGSRSGYDRGCPCVGCRAAAAKCTAVNRARRQGRPRGREQGPRVPLGATTFAHMQRLLAIAPPRSVAEASGVSAATMARLAAGNASSVAYRMTAELILATEPEDVIAVAGKIATDIVRRRISKIVAEGGTLTGIADHVGVRQEAITRIVRGDYDMVRGPLARAILSTTADTARSVYATVDPEQSVRRREALRANGWTVELIAAEAGLLVSTVEKIGQSPSLRWETAETLRKAYERIGDRPGPSDITRRRARAQGARQPICYDEEMNLVESSVRTADNLKHDREQRRARLNLCSIRLYIDGMGPEEIRSRLRCSGRFPDDMRKDLAIPSGASPAQADAIALLRPLIEAATNDLDYTTYLDHLDDDGIDYAARHAALVADCAAIGKERRALSLAA